MIKDDNLKNIITSVKNKELLWNTLYSNGIFDQIPNDNLSNIKDLFEKTINYYVENIKLNNNFSLIEHNKNTLEQLFKNIKNYKSDIFLQKPIKDDYINNKNADVLNNLKNKEADMNASFNITKPKPIDFSDKNDEPIDNNDMNKLLEQMLNQRGINDEITNINMNKTIDKTIDNDINETISIDNEAPKLKISSFNDLLDIEVDDNLSNKNYIENPNQNKIISLEIVNNNIKLLDNKVEKLIELFSNLTKKN
tara:strand:- start:4906 stop:5661 length:756 start_codon:yes stop_codon:yes gene_type:complete